MISRTGASAAAFLTLSVLVAWTVPAASAVGDRVAGEQALLVTGVAAEVADPEQELAEDPQPAGEATVTELEIVVPPVDGSGEVVADAEVREAQAAPDVVVADEVTGAERVQSDVVETEDFQLLGVTWPADAEASDLDIQVRTRVEGDWTEWVPLEEGDIAPDAGTADAENAVRGGTDSLWVGEADAVQLSFAATEEGGPDGLGLALVDVPEAEVPEAEVPETATAAGASFGLPDRLGTIQANQAVFRPEALDAATEQALSTALLGVPSAVASAPRVISRAEWGARPQVCAPDVATQLVGAAVHHTAGSNSYSTVAEAARQIRGDQAYHIDGRGWCDLGYNFVVDKWGNIYEGRANSLTQPVVGVHAGGFNTGTVGVAMLGTYAAAPSAATQEAVAQIIGWRLGAYGVDPRGSTSYTTGVGENSRYQNQTVTLPRVFGHRDVAYTNCPGDGGYAALGNIRARAKAHIGAIWVNPALTASTAPMGSSIGITAGVISSIDWTLRVVDVRTGVEVRWAVGTAGPSERTTIVTWNGTSLALNAVGPGPYRMTLTGTETGTGRPVAPWSGVVTITGSQNPPTVAPVPLTGNLAFVPITPARVLDTRPTAQSIGPNSRVDVTVAGVAGVPADAKAVAVSITAVHASTVTHIRAWPAGQARPSTSVLNADATRSASAAGVILGVGGEGKISLYNNAGSTHLLVDVTGYFTTGAGQGYAQLGTAARVLDTRETGGRMANGQRRTVTVAGQAGIPAGATAVVVNATSVGATSEGHVAVVPSGATSSTSSVNHLPGADVTNRTIVPLAGGKVDVLLRGGSAHVVLDVVGWFGPGASATFTPITPVRAFDTRTGGGVLDAGEARTVSVAAAGLPADVTGVVMTLTAAAPTAPATYLTVWPAGSPRPGTSDLNTGRGRDQANNAVVGLGPGGALDVYNNLGSSHVIGDVFGYFR